MQPCPVANLTACPTWELCRRTRLLVQHYCNTCLISLAQEMYLLKPPVPWQPPPALTEFVEGTTLKRIGSTDQFLKRDPFLGNLWSRWLGLVDAPLAVLTSKSWKSAQLCEAWTHHGSHSRRAYSVAQLKCPAVTFYLFYENVSMYQHEGKRRKGKRNIKEYKKDSHSVVGVADVDVFGQMVACVSKPDDNGCSTLFHGIREDVWCDH